MSRPSDTEAEPDRNGPPGDALRLAAVRIATVLREADHEAYFAGGCVRDDLLGKRPKDYDIATSAHPKQVRRLFPRANLVGAHFGVILIHEPEGDFEIATFRTDGDYVDGRRPKEVQFSNAEQDARRRDFTINGLFEVPGTGEIIDFVGGREDLESRQVRAIGDPVDRFREDHLRMLRAVRFATVLDFAIEDETAAAIRHHAAEIARISAERVRDELVRTLNAPRRLLGFDLLDETGLLREILPEVAQLKGCPDPEWRTVDGDLFERTRGILERLPADAPAAVVLGALLHGIGKSSVEASVLEREEAAASEAAEILRRLRFSNEVLDRVVALVKHRDAYGRATKMSEAELRRFMALPEFEDGLTLHRAVCAARGRPDDDERFLRQRRGSYDANRPLIPPRLLSGNDLIQAGWPSGPLVGKILHAVQTEQLEERLTTREEALRWVAAKFPKP